MTDPDLELLRSVGADPLDLPFWRGCRQGVFRLHRCAECERCYWPASCCVAHGARSMHWVDSAGRGTLYTYTVMHHAYTPAMKQKVPYVVGVIQLVEGPFFHSNVIDCALSEISVGMPVSVVMQTQDNGLVLPMFRPL